MPPSVCAKRLSVNVLYCKNHAINIKSNKSCAKSYVRANVQHEVKFEVFHLNSPRSAGAMFPGRNFIQSHLVRKTEVSYGQDVVSNAFVRANVVFSG